MCADNGRMFHKPQGRISYNNEEWLRYLEVTLKNALTQRNAIKFYLTFGKYYYFIKHYFSIDWGFVMSYLRVRLNFWWGCLFHFSWIFIFVVLFTSAESLFEKPYIDKTDAYSLIIEEKPFFDSDLAKPITIDSQDGKLKRLDAQQYQLQAVLDTLYGKNEYYSTSSFLKIDFDSKEGIAKDKFIDLITEEYDIISMKTYKKME